MEKRSMAFVVLLSAALGWVAGEAARRLAPDASPSMRADAGSTRAPTLTPSTGGGEELAAVQHAAGDEMTRAMVGEDDLVALAALYGRLAAAPIRSLPALLDQARRLDDAYLRWQAMEAVYARWNVLDAPASLQALERLQPAEQVLMAEQLYFGWARRAPDAAIEAVAAETSLQRQHRAVRGILRAVRDATDDFQLSITEALDDPGMATQLLLEDISLHAMTEPSVAFARARHLVDLSAREQALAWVASGWARTDPADAYRHVLTLESSVLRENTLSVLLGRWAHRDPETVLTLIERSPPHHATSSMLVSTIAERLAETDPERALAVVARMGGGTHGAYWRVFTAWAQRDPRAAAQRLLQLDGTVLSGSGLLQSVAGEYARRHPDEVLDWVSAIDSRRLRGDALGGALGALASVDPMAALAVLPQLVEDPTWQASAPGVISEVAKTSPDLAVQFLDYVDDAQERTSIRSAIVDAWAARDPQAALAWIETLTDEDYLGAMQKVAYTVARRQIDVAIALLPSVRGPAREVWMTSIASRYAETDRARALSWLRQFEDDPYRDAVIASMVGNWAFSQPESAMAEARRIGDEAVRASAMARVVRQWVTQDLTTAAAQIADIPAGVERQRTVNAVARSMVDEDLERALVWWRTLPTRADREGALVSIMGAPALTPAQAVDVLEAIEDPTSRHDGARRYLSRVAYGDLDEGRRFLEQVGAELDADALTVLEYDYRRLVERYRGGTR